MEPKVVVTSEENNVLNFTMSNIHHSLANSLRRICLSEIPTFVFKTTPYSENETDIITNTTRLNNEIIKQRLSCIPIHISDLDFPYQEYVVELNKENTNNIIEYVTTADFKIKKLVDNTYLSDRDTKEIFPPNIITGDYVTLSRLKPKLSENIQGEHLHFVSKINIDTASTNGMYNVVSTCSYGNTVDHITSNDKWNDKKKELIKNEVDESSIFIEEQNWKNLTGKRITLDNSFDFTVETVGVYSNFTILYKACDVMINKCNNLIDMLEKADIEIELNSDTTIENEYVITLKNEDYTIGNALVYFLYTTYYEGKNSPLSFVGFKIPHPHIPNGIIRMAFENISDVNTVSMYLTNAAEKIITTFKNIQINFKE